MSIATRLTAWLLDDRRASYGLALMRIVYGGMTLLTLALSAPHLSYSFGRASHWGQARTSISATNEFFWPLPLPFGREDSDAVLYAKVALLAVVALAYTLGWRMRIVSPLFVFLWLGFTMLNPVILNSGHYQPFRIMIILMLFADLSRRWSLDARRRARRGVAETDAVASRIPRWLTNLLNNTAVVLIGFQLCTIYIASALWKLQGNTWISGHAVYYPLRLEELTLFPALNSFVWHLTPLVLIASWMSVYLQLLFPLFLLNRWTRIAALLGITAMHAGIGVLMALPWFSLVMIAADMLFIREESWAKARAVGRRQRERWLGRGQVRESAQSSSGSVVVDLP